MTVDASARKLNFIPFLEKAIKNVEYIYKLDNELARLSYLNHLEGYLKGGLEIAKLYEDSDDH